MNRPVLSIVLAASMLHGATLPQLPVSPFVDTEVSTNVPLTNLTGSAPVWGNVSTWTSLQLLARGAISPDETFIVNQSHIGTIIQFR